MLSDSVLLEAEQTIELLMCLSDYQSQWRLSLPASLQLLMVLHILLADSKCRKYLFILYVLTRI